MPDSGIFGVPTMIRIFFVISMILLSAPSAESQIPHAPQIPAPTAPGVQYAPGPQQAPPQAQQQQPLEYAFRPNLTNPEYGECLNLEKSWQAIWSRYYQEYQRMASMNQNDPQYQQMTFYLQTMKRQLDAAWNNFSSRCVYFPQRGRQ